MHGKRGIAGEETKETGNLIKAVLFDLGDTLIVEEAVEGRHLWEVTLQKVPHVDEVLQALRQRYRLGIITNTVTSREHHVRTALRRIGLEHYFDVILTSVDVGCDKPDEKIFLKALRALDVLPEEAVMVGNRISTDIVGANRIGMKTVLFKWNERYPEEAGSPSEQPTHTISSLKELPRVLSEFEKEE
ncbi:MAG: HAD family hydrolase [Candidatus Bathyarchaeia archaeon]